MHKLFAESDILITLWIWKLPKPGQKVAPTAPVLKMQNQTLDRNSIFDNKETDNIMAEK